MTLGAPFGRQFDCHATLGRSASDPLGLLHLTVRDGKQAAAGIVYLPSASSGHYSVADGVRAYLDMRTLVGFDYSLVVDRYNAGADITVDISVGAELGAGVSAVRGTLQGVFSYSNGTVLVPFAVEFGEPLPG